MAFQRECQKNRRRPELTITGPDCLRTLDSKDDLVQHPGHIPHRRKIEEIFEKSEEYFYKT